MFTIRARGMIARAIEAEARRRAITRNALINEILEAEYADEGEVGAP